MTLEIAPELETLVRVGSIEISPVAIAPAGPALEAEMEEIRVSLEERWRGTAPSEIPGLAPARDLYRAFGIDPTRTRPSSEALLRRAAKGKPLPRILNAVDVANLCSLRFLLPLGLYDTDKIVGDVTLRRGRAGESYPGIRKDDVHLEGRPTLADDRGPFGNPTSDSARTSVGEGTRSLWMVIFAPVSYPPDAMRGHVEQAREAMATHLVPEGVEPESRVRVLP